MYVYDTTPPVVEPIALLSNNSGVLPVSFDASSGIVRRPGIAKAGDKIDIVIRTNEPVVYIYTADDLNEVIFKSSTQSFRSGLSASSDFDGVCRTGPTNARVNTKCLTGGSQSNFSTYLFNAIQPTVSPGDIEGFFNFSGLIVRDRAGNDRLINSEQFGSYHSGLWIDPIAPQITSSGFVNNTVIYSGLAQEDNVYSSGITPTSGVSGFIIYSVSGVLDYEFTIKENFNEITSGAVNYIISLKPTNKFVNSGFSLVGQIPAGFFNSGLSTQINSSNPVTVPVTNTSPALRLEANSYIGLSSGFSDFAHKLDTNSLENGTYELIIFLEDYAGNVNLVTYYINVENPLQYIDLTIESESSGIIAMNFSNTIGASGLQLVSTDIQMTIIRSDGQNVPPSSVVIIEAIEGRRILVRVSVNEGADQFKFLADDDIRILIRASGIAKLFSTFDEPIIETSDNVRELSDWPTDMPGA
jgi:hypothetical protein